MQPSHGTPWTPVPRRPEPAPAKERNGETVFAAYYTDDAGKQRQKTLAARTLTEAKREQRALAVATGRGTRRRRPRASP